jgi:phenylacetate-CoA ligase
MGKLDAVYRRLPVWAQNGAVSTFGAYWYWIRFGPGYKADLAAFEARERMSADEWHRWQREQLKELLGKSSTHVPYYDRTWSRAEKAAAAAGELGDLPLLEKEALRADPQSFVRTDMHPRRQLKFFTSGSTGTPVTALWTIDEFRRSRALREARSARWAGVSFRLPRATFSGRMVVPDPNSGPPYHRYNRVERQAYMSAFHLRPDTAADYLAAFRKHGLVWATGYAVSFYLLSRFVLERDLERVPIRSIITTSEKVTPPMRRVMEEAFECRVFEEYSTVENALFASECEHGRLHVSPDIGYIEILRPDGTRCDPGEAGEVVATGLMREYQPMIRYRLGDMASWDERPCECGREMPVLKEVLGRVEDVVVGADGRRMVRFHGIFIDQPHVREGQIVQQAVDRILVKVVPTDGFGADDETDIVQRVQQRLGAKTSVSVEVVHEIPRTKAGKFQAVVSLLGKDEPGTETTGLAVDTADQDPARSR